MIEEPCPKVAYTSRRAANLALKTIKHGRITRQKRPRRAYKCETCGQFHLTSKYTYKEEEERRKNRNKKF